MSTSPLSAGCGGSWGPPRLELRALPQSLPHRTCLLTASAPCLLLGVPWWVLGASAIVSGPEEPGDAGVTTLRLWHRRWDSDPVHIFKLTKEAGVSPAVGPLELGIRHGQ